MSDSDDNDERPCTQAVEEDDNGDFFVQGDECCATTSGESSSLCQHRGSMFATYPLLKPPTTLETDVMEFMVLDIVFSKQRVVLFGRDVCGGSVALFVRGWYPYVLMEACVGDAASFADLLDDKMDDEWRLLDADNNSHKGNKRPSRFIHEISVVDEKQKSILGYDGKPWKTYWKICVTEPRFLWLLRTCMSKVRVNSGGVLVDSSMGTQLYNASIDPTLQFMVDVGMMGCEWCRIEGGGSTRLERETTCGVELHDLTPQDLKFIAGKEEIAPLRILSFDIEAAGRRGVFPQAMHDPVIQIALHFKVWGCENEQPVPILLSLRACDAIDDANVFCYEDEKDLLLAFRDLVLDFDADVFTGYNICNFDFLYLRDRAVALECGDEFARMTRMERSPLYLRETVFQSVQMGKRKRVRVGVTGRVCLDMLTCIQNNQAYRLDSYKLNSVAEYFLGDHKVDLPFTQITPMWMRDAAARRELGLYCLKDALLPLDLIDKLDSLTQTVEMARCAGIPFDWVLQRGIMIRNSSLLLRRAKERAFIFPLMPPKESTGKYAGATVLDAIVGIHNHVGVLDFSAMYPSIIRAHNLCYSSYLPPAPAPAPTTFAYEEHNGQRFVTSAVHKGLLPEVVEHLQNCRNKAKAAYAAATDPMQKRVHKAREMAFKICNNGMYGSLGSTQSLLPLMEIAQTVTAIGRSDIKQVKGMAETMFPDAQVVYGDTDSVFIKFCVSEAAKLCIPDSIAEVMEKSKSVAQAVNAVMQKPKKIEYEKAYSVMLLLSKKRYAGLKFTEDHVYGKAPPVELKGVQSVRRDGCMLVRELVGECLTSILESGSITDAASLARRRLLDVVEDKVLCTLTHIYVTCPILFFYLWQVALVKYAINKTLRKTIQDCSMPHSRQELRDIRLELLKATKPLKYQEYMHLQRELKTRLPMTEEPPDLLKKMDHILQSVGGDTEQLSYAEQDECIHKRIKIIWKSRVKLPHVCLAWKLRMQDPGSAPVPGESLNYIVTVNATKQIADKVETLEYVEKHPATVVDRAYYLESLKTPIDNLFAQVFLQQILQRSGRTRASKQNEQDALTQVKNFIWIAIAGKPLSQDPHKRAASIAASPLAQMFKKQKPS